MGTSASIEALRIMAARIELPNDTARNAAIDKWNAVAKPIGSLGMLEDDIVRIAALVGTKDFSLAKPAAVILCADNGVVAQGISQCGQEVTCAVANNIARNNSSVCTMAKTAGIDVIGVDMGMVQPADSPVIRDRAIARGTADITQGPAMTQEQALQAIRIGIDLVRELKDEGYDILASGEMGIGNTTTSSALASVLLNMPVESVTGRGAGLSDEGLQRKIAAIKAAISVNSPDPDEPLDMLAKLGGFDIAGLVGLYIGGAIHRVPIIVDGFISALSALIAKRLVPESTCCMIASHVSTEPATQAIMQELEIAAPIQARLRLGEGTGAICLIPMLRMAFALYNGTSFAQTGIDAYDPSLVES